MSRSLRTLFIATAAALGGFLFGYDTAVINGAVAALGLQFHSSGAALGLAVSSTLIGSAFGALVAGRLADRYGRVRAMQMTAVIFILSGIFSGAAMSFLAFTLWRLVGGVAIGLASVIAPTYIAEIAPAAFRGRLGSLQQLAIVFGIFTALMTDYVIALHAGSATHAAWFGIAAWRWMFFSEVLPAIAYGVASLLIPESPRHLVAVHREAEALTILRALVGAQADSKLQQISDTLGSEQAPRWSDLRANAGGILPIVWIGIVLSMLQQFVGINVIFYYSSVLWQSVGFSEHEALRITVFTSVTNIATTVIAIFTVDKLGRKPLLLYGSIGMTVTLAILAAIFARASLDATGHPMLSHDNGLVALVAANVYVFCFGFSWGPVVWVLLGEMFNNRIRALALSIAAMAQWLANFAVTATFPSLQKLGLGFAYGMYAAAALLSFLFVRYYIAETRGKELEEM